MDDDKKDEVPSDDDVDIYADIGDFHFDRELTKLENSNKAYIADISCLTAKLKQLSDRNSELETVNDILVTNISILLKTAKAEIERKQLVIEEFRKKINNMNRSSGNFTSRFCKNCEKKESVQITGKPNKYDQDKENHIEDSPIEEGEIVQDDDDNDDNVDSDEDEEKKEEKCYRKLDQANNDEKNGNPNKHYERPRNKSKSRERSEDRHSNRRNYRPSLRSDTRHSYRSSRHHRYSPKDRRYTKRKRSREKSQEKRAPVTRRAHSYRTERTYDKKEEYKITERDKNRNPKSSSVIKKESSKKNDPVKSKKSEEKFDEMVEGFHAKPLASNEFKPKDSRPDDCSHNPLNNEDTSLKEKVLGKEKCDVRKVGSKEKSDERNNFVDSLKETEVHVFSTESVLANLYDEPPQSEFSSRDTAVTCIDDDHFIQPTATSEKFPDAILQQKKPKVVRKPRKTLYTRRMEAKLLQVQKEEEALKNVSNVESVKTKQLTKDIVKEVSNEDMIISCPQKTQPNEITSEELVLKNENKVDVNPKVFNECTEKEKSDYMYSDVLNEKHECTKNSNDVNTGPMLVIENVSLTVSEKTITKEISPVCDIPEKTHNVSLNCETPQLASGESLFKKLFSLQNLQKPHELKEFSPLKNNYRLLKISPLKPTVMKQHILEYYNLVLPSSQQFSNLELGFDSSMSVPITPGKNVMPWCSTPTDCHESVKGESDDTSDQLKIFDDDKSFEDDKISNVELVDVAGKISPVFLEKISPGKMLFRTPNDDRTVAISETENVAKKNCTNNNNNNNNNGNSNNSNNNSTTSTSTSSSNSSSSSTTSSSSRSSSTNGSRNNSNKDKNKNKRKNNKSKLTKVVCNETKDIKLFGRPGSSKLAVSFNDASANEKCISGKDEICDSDKLRDSSGDFNCRRTRYSVRIAGEKSKSDNKKGKSLDKNRTFGNSDSAERKNLKRKRTSNDEDDNCTNFDITSSRKQTVQKSVAVKNNPRVKRVKHNEEPTKSDEKSEEFKSSSTNSTMQKVNVLENVMEEVKLTESANSPKPKAELSELNLKLSTLNQTQGNEMNVSWPTDANIMISGKTIESFNLEVIPSDVENDTGSEIFSDSDSSGDYSDSGASALVDLL